MFDARTRVVNFVFVTGFSRNSLEDIQDSLVRAVPDGVDVLERKVKEDWDVECPRYAYDAPTSRPPGTRGLIQLFLGQSHDAVHIWFI